MSGVDTGLFTAFLALGMLITGTINTLTTKFQDLQVVKGYGDAPPSAFEHAFFQTACMFIGELICLFAFRISKLFEKAPAKEEVQVDDSVPTQNKKYINPLLFWIPACCDLGGTTLLNVGLFLTNASVYQMLRGSLVVFTGILSVIFLKAKLYYHHWGGIVLIVIGTVLVGLSSVLNVSSTPSSSARNPLVGNVLVVAAQVLAAIQFVVEEKLLKNVDAAPLQVVGWEGFFGLSMCTFVLFGLYWIPGGDYHSFENAPYAISQMLHSAPLAIAVVGSICSIAFFNFFGISIAKRASSTTRSTIDSTRTFLIWICSMILGWETFHWLQLLGFSVLLLGSMVSNEVLKIPYYHEWYIKRKTAWEEREL
jgi:drug/metabolite transporter (DMT)-like permease